MPDTPALASVSRLAIAPASWCDFFAHWQALRQGPPALRLNYVVVNPPPWPPAGAADSVGTGRFAIESRRLAFEPMARALDANLWGLLPGFHRLSFDDGRVLLTVCVGETLAMLREQAFTADSVLLDFDAAPADSLRYLLKALARCCRLGTRLAGAQQSVSPAARKALTQSGFVVDADCDANAVDSAINGNSGNTAINSPAWHARYAPHWAVKPHTLPVQTPPSSRHCLVVGAGLAGAAVAASLARRGWHVKVLDSAATPASGASGLPAGVMAPHVSPDDSRLSRLSRAGIRVTLQQAAALLEVGQDYAITGVLERCLTHPRQRPAAWLQGPCAVPAADWARQASATQLAACALSADDAAPALWHVHAGWVKPAQLVNAWLATPGVQWQGGCSVARLQRLGGQWLALDSAGSELARGDRVVLAAGHATAALALAHAAQPLVLQPIRGQVTWAYHGDETSSDTQALPAFPVNGHGHLLARVPLASPGQACSPLAWMTGASFQRDRCALACESKDDAHNLHRLHALVPVLAQQLQAGQPAPKVQAWAGVRCATPTRMPSVGPLGKPDRGLWICTGMGARGLSFAALCAELLAAQWQGEPWPIEASLARAFAPTAAPPPSPAGT